MLIIDEGSLRPKRARNLFSREQLTRVLQQQKQYLKGLRVQPDANALAAQLPGRGVCLVDSEAISPDWLNLWHWNSRV